VRQVIGKATRDVDAAAFAALRAPYPYLLLDLGAGDGKHALVEAHRRPDTLVVALDAAPDAMRATAARAAAKPARGGVSNAIFVWASAEQLPAELADVTELHCLMPWGSLLRALVRPDEAVLRRVAAACRPSAPFLVTLNLHAWRPRVPEVGDSAEPAPDSIGELAAAYARAGWRLDIAAYLSGAQIVELGTSWTKRLGASRESLDALALRGTIQDGC
jgi:16S rRNA (adenine(1408)-N(1))-methyltransferase